MLFALLLISVSVRENAAQEVRVKQQDIDVSNYTSCEDFLTNYTFDPRAVVDIDWKIFYFWNDNFEESYEIKFSYPPDVLVDRFRVELDKEMKPPVNWSDAVLFMETSIDFSALFVKTNNSGIFKVIPSVAFEYNDIPAMIFALKVVEPGYLGILNCKLRMCYALAPINKMPNHDDLTIEAQKLGFWNDFGRTHTAIIPSPSTIPPEHILPDDDDEDEHLEVAMHDKLQFF